MRRTLHIALALTVLLSLFSLSGCCSHEYETEVIREATCAEEGEAILTCTKCGENHTEVIPKTDDHQFVETVIREATCAEEGEAETVCSVCGLKQNKTIEKTGNHTFVDEVKTPATCTATGKLVHRCSVCGEETEEEIPKAEHQYQEKIIQAATCAATGTKTLTCKVCGESHNETIPKNNDHQYQEKLTQAATCAAAGTKTLTCKICGQTKTETIPVNDDHAVGWGKCPRCGRMSTKLKDTAREIRKYAMRGVQDLNDCMDYMSLALNNASYASKAVMKFLTRGMFAAAVEACGNYSEFADVRDCCKQIITGLDHNTMPSTIGFYNDYRDLAYFDYIRPILREIAEPLSRLPSLLSGYPS